MLFEVVNRYNEVVMRTDYDNCIPDIATLASMYGAGYTFRYKGKAISLKKMKELFKEEKRRDGE